MIYDDFLTLRRRIIEKEFSKMNPMQQEAIYHVNGPLLLLAGAGSGKTTVLVNRIANIIKYGDAYNSDKCVTEITEDDISVLEMYLNGEDIDFSCISPLLCVDPPAPWEILAITFTNKAAGELKSRLSVMLGDISEEIWASTFHSACSKILRRNAKLIGYTNNFTIYDTDDSRRLMKEAQKLLNIDDKMLSHKEILKEISKAKDELKSPQDYFSEAGNDIRKINIAKAYECYQRLLINADAMDFDDMIFNTVTLLKNNPEVRHYYQNRFKYILVDEYQDTNHAQYVLTSLLADKYKNICVVGDDDQSIYRFRGATIENILSFEKRYPNARVIRLEQNYRSTQTILDAANAVIANNINRKGKNLWTANGNGEKITINTSYDEKEEARFVAETILKNVKDGKKMNDHAVLYRMNAQSGIIENAFVRSGIPYKIIGGLRFYERKEIKDALAYLTVINNPSDNVRLRRIINEPKRGIGDTTLLHVSEIANQFNISMFEVMLTADKYPVLQRAQKKLLEFSNLINNIINTSESLSPSQILTEVLKQTEYFAYLDLDKETADDRKTNLKELQNNLIRYENETVSPSLNGFLEEIALMTDIDNYNDENDNVVMMTLHSAKGLEFPEVFLVGMEEGVFPGAQSMFYPEDIEEERRLAYVGITRAKHKLYLCNARTRLMYGSTSHNQPSRFLNEIPSQLTVVTGVRTYSSAQFSRNDTDNSGSVFGSDTRSAAKSFNRGFSGKSQPSPIHNSNVSTDNNKFKIGDTVFHSVFGTGVIISAKPVGNDTFLEVAFEKSGTKKLMANYAKLKKM